jgi:hypothetical protein
MHFARDQAHDVVRILPVIAPLVRGADDVIGRRQYLGKIDPLWVIENPLERPNGRHED